MINLIDFLPLASAKAPAAALASALVLTGCISPVAGPGGNYTQPIGGSPVTANPTPYSEGLVCMGHYARQSGVRAPRSKMASSRHRCCRINCRNASRWCVVTR